MESLSPDSIAYQRAQEATRIIGRPIVKANTQLSPRDFLISRAIKTLANQANDNYIRDELKKILKLVHQA